MQFHELSALCDVTSEPIDCDDTGASEQEQRLDDYFYVFMLAMIIQGFGCISLFTVGYTILEDSLPKEKSALYIGTLTVYGKGLFIMLSENKLCFRTC